MFHYYARDEGLDEVDFGCRGERAVGWDELHEEIEGFVVGFFGVCFGWFGRLVIAIVMVIW